MSAPRPLTASQERRAKHPGVDEDGHCTRCGLHYDCEDDSSRWARCPPGFWMNKNESKAWARGAYEEP